MTGVVNVSVFMIGLSAHRDRKYPEHSTVVPGGRCQNSRMSDINISISVGPGPGQGKFVPV